MLRKGFHIVVAFLLILTTAGITVSKHYCNANLISVSVYDKATPCNHNNHDNCCHDSEIYFQVEDDFDLNESSNLPDLTAQKSLFFSAANLFVTQKNSTQNFHFAVLKFPFPDQPNLAKLQRLLL
jgi:hypothetical protein